MGCEAAFRSLLPAMSQWVFNPFDSQISVAEGAKRFGSFTTQITQDFGLSVEGSKAPHNPLTLSKRRGGTTGVIEEA